MNFTLFSYITLRYIIFSTFISLPISSVANIELQVRNNTLFLLSALRKQYLLMLENPVRKFHLLVTYVH